MMDKTFIQRGTATGDRGPLEVITRPISGLKLDPKNPREHRPKQIRQIAKSITAFGFNVPVLIDAQHRVIAGHGRILACQQLGWTDVPTICLPHLTAAQRQAFMIADNRLTEQSTWDERLLGEQLKELAEVNLDFHLEATGFDIGEIDLLIEGALPVAEEANDPADATPAPAAGPPVTQPGDVWLLGPHRVSCGNALEDATYQILMGQRHAALVFIDAPYNVPIAGHASGLGRITHREFVMASGELSEREFTAFLSHMLTHASRYSAEGTLLYTCMDWRHLRELLGVGNFRQVLSVIRINSRGGTPATPRGKHQAEALGGGSLARSAYAVGDCPKKAVRPRDRRALARWAQTTYQVSERRVSRLVLMARASLRYQEHRDRQDALRMRLRELAAARVRFGYGRLTVLLPTLRPVSSAPTPYTFV